MALVVNNPSANAGDIRGLIPGSGRSPASPGGGGGNPLQYSCLENPMDRRAWQATVHQVIKSQTWQSYLTRTVLVCLTLLSLPWFLQNAGKQKGTNHGAFAETPAPSAPWPTYFVNGHSVCFPLEASFSPLITQTSLHTLPVSSTNIVRKVTPLQKEIMWLHQLILSCFK